MIEEGSPASSCSWGVGPFGKKPGFSPIPDFLSCTQLTITWSHLFSGDQKRTSKVFENICHPLPFALPETSTDGVRARAAGEFSNTFSHTCMGKTQPFIPTTKKPAFHMQAISSHLSVATLSGMTTNCLKNAANFDIGLIGHLCWESKQGKRVRSVRTPTSFVGD